MSGAIFINPGSGPVPGASAEAAEANLATFAEDLRSRGHQVQVGQATGEEEGRWSFPVTVDDVVHQVEMPGLPLEQVRWLDEPDQNIWHFPRLYVDGSSWVWKYALDAAADPQ